MDTRIATPSDIPTLTRLINTAYVVERFFKIGDRIGPDGVRVLLSKEASCCSKMEATPSVRSTSSREVSADISGSLPSTQPARYGYGRARDAGG